jgi:hypothetical protein
MGLGPRTGGISDSEAKEHTDRCGGDPVHPSAAAYRKMAEDISKDLSNAEARYTNPVKATFKPDHKRPQVDFSLQRDDWVSGCPTALPRRDIVPSVRARGKTPSRRYTAMQGGGLQRGRGWSTQGGTRGWGGM